MDNVIFLKPYFVPKIWGGNELKAFNYTLPSNSIGEA
jgi:mannose-6-phosphate isomerase class I